MKLLSLLLTILSAISIEAQNITLTGKVTDASTGKDLANVVVSIRPEGETKILKFGTTKADGTFSLSLKAMPEGKSVIHFAIMGFATSTLPLTADRTVYNIALKEKATELKGVNIKAPSIRERGDTIAYSVASFADAGDKSLSDVLKKMPGIEVQENGTIKYNGKEINKFYIEGHDMLGSRYSLASNNIHQEDVGTVEVMTNHQPIKALEDMVFSENPAINIKLKEAAKSRWVGTVKLGGGAEDRDFVWNGELALMRFAKTTQSLNTLKSNNIGIDVTRELVPKFDDFDGGSLGKTYSMKSYINATPDRLWDISDSRVRQNRTHAVSTNNLWALNATTDLTSQVSYSNDRLVSSAISSTQYFLNDTTIVNDDSEHAKQKQHAANVNLTISSNGAKAYISNKLSADLQWNDVTMDIIQNARSVQQEAAMPKYKFTDNFEVILRRGQKAYTFDTYNAYMRNPHSLTVGDVRQSVESSVYFNHTHTSLGFHFNPFTISMEVGIQVLSRAMESILEGISDTMNVHNDVSMTFIRAYVSPNAEFKRGGWHITFKMPFSYVPYVFNDKIASEKHTANKAQASPNLNITYDFSPRLRGSLSGGIRQSEVNEQNFYMGLIMHDYRNLYRGFVDYTSDNSKNITLSMQYKRPLSMFFMNGYISKIWTDSHLTTARDFLDDFIVNSYYADNSKSEFIMAGGRISEGLSFMCGLISVSYEYMQNDRTMRQGDITSDYSSANHTYEAKLNGRPIQWFNFEYKIACSKSVMRMKDADMKSTTTDLAQKLTLNFNPTEQWQIRLIGDHFRNQVAENQHKNLYLADASTSYSLKNGIELTLWVLNLFDQRTYGYTVNENLSRMSKEYQLRARTIIGSVFLHF